MAQELITAVVTEYESRSRIAALSGSEGEVKGIVVPLSVQGVTPKSTVLYHPTSGVVVALLSYDMSMSYAEDFVPGASGGYVQSRYNNQQSTRSVPGDMIMQSPHSGFLYALKKFKAGIGGSGFSKIMFYGLRNAIEITAKNFSITNGSTINDSTISMTMRTLKDGSSRIKLKVGTSMLETDGAKYFNVSLGVEGHLFNLLSNDKELQVSILGNQVFKINSETNEATAALVTPLKAVIEAVSLVVKDTVVMKVSKSTSYSTGSLAVQGGEFMRLMANSVTLNATNTSTVKGQHVKLTASSKQGNAGTVTVYAGKKAGISLDGGTGAAILKGKKIELLGKGEHLANGDSTKTHIENLYGLIDGLATTLMSSPTPAPTAPLCPKAAETKVKAFTQSMDTHMIPNSYIEVPTKGRVNGLKPKMG